MITFRETLAPLVKRTDPVTNLPRSLYIKRPIANAATIVAWAKAQGLPTTLLPADMHCTIIYNKAPVSWATVPPAADTLTVPALYGVRSVHPLGDDGAIVLQFESTELSARWRDLIAVGCRSSHPSFTPHITLTYDPGEVDVSKIQPYQGRIEFGPEVFAEIKSDGPRWLDTIQEKHMAQPAIQPAFTEADIVAFLKGKDPAIAALLEKDMSVGDVHQATSLGNDPKKGGAKTFKDTLAEAKAKAPAADDDVDKAFEVPLDIVKTDADKMLIFGWASVSTIDGKLIFDKQQDAIEPHELEAAAYDFCLYSRTQGDLHVKKGVGRMVESMFFSKEKQELMKIDLGLEGWWVGFKTDDPGLWAAVKRGERPEFSIGGKAVRVPV